MNNQTTTAAPRLTLKKERIVCLSNNGPKGNEKMSLTVIFTMA